VLAYRSLTGTLPFSEDNGVRILRAILNAELIPPSGYDAALGPGVDAFFARAFAPNIQDRFQDAASFSSALAMALDLEPHSSSLEAASIPSVRSGHPLAAEPGAPAAGAAHADPDAATVESAGKKGRPGEGLLAAMRRLWTA
jgi:hypothetical protein